MNAIRATRQLNQRELDNAVPPSASWHVDYRDTAYVYIGGLPLDLSEGDIVTIFSQFGHPTHLNLVRDRETGKSRGFAFLKYEDQRSCDLAVDNLGGAEVLGRTLRVDHSRYKKKDGEDEDTWRIDRLENEGGDGAQESDTGDDRDESEEERRRRKKRKVVKAEKETLAIEQGIDDEDPMKDYLLQERREESQKATVEGNDRRHKHHHRRSHRDRDGKDDDDDRKKARRTRDRDADSDGDHKSRRHRDAERDGNDDDSHKHRHRDRRDEDEDSRRKDRNRDRDRDRDNQQDQKRSRHSHDATTTKPRERGMSKSRSRSPERRDRRRRSRSRDRGVDSKKPSRYSRSPSIERNWNPDRYRDVRRRRDYE